MKDYTNIMLLADQLLKKRGISGHTAADRFASDFKAYLIYFDAISVGCAETLINMLSDDANLTDNSILSTNFRKSFNDLVHKNLRTNPVFQELFPIMLENKGKGVGEGELALPLIIRGYKFSNTSDGILDNGAKVEVKKNGASLKPVATGVTEKGLVDRLNKKYWNGTVPGKRSKTLFEAHLKTVKDPADYAKYFKELYVGCDVAALSTEVLNVFRDPEMFNTALGKFALREYQKVDGWQNILYLDIETQTVVNIADTTNISGLGLKFNPVLRRNKDTQAIADGYVNVSI